MYTLTLAVLSSLVFLIEGIVCLSYSGFPRASFCRQNRYSRSFPLSASSPDKKTRRYKLGLGRNKPLGEQDADEVVRKVDKVEEEEVLSEKYAWLGPIVAPQNLRNRTNSSTLTTTSNSSDTQLLAASILNAKKKTTFNKTRIRMYKVGLGKNLPLTKTPNPVKKKALVGYDEQSHFLSRAIWNEDHFDLSAMEIPKEIDQYHYDPENSIDTTWQVMRYEAKQEAQREPLLVSFLYSSIINHPSLESALAFHLANLLSSPAMISTQVMSLCLEALYSSQDFRISLRKDILAVRDRDPACTCLPDVFLYFKGFHALQTYRVAHYLWKSGRQMLALHFQSQMSQVFQVDIHPNATLGNGIMLDHGTGIVIGETAVVGHNCSILHHVTLGGSGKAGVDRHPKIGDGVLLGAGASVLGNVRVGDGCQIGAGTLLLQDLPPHCVAVGVPAKIIGSFIDVRMQPSQSMNQTIVESTEEMIPFDTETSFNI